MAIDGTAKSLAGLFIGSLMVMIQSAKLCDQQDDCKDYLGWSLACAVIGAAIALTAFILLKVCPEFKKSIGWVVLVIVTACLWIAGVATMTFKRPYKSTLDNGYFGAWIATLSSVQLLSAAFQSVFEDCKKKLPIEGAWDWWFTLFAASVVATAQSAIDCDDAADCKDELAWALAASSISLTVTLVMVILACVTDCGAEAWKWISLFLVLWWMCGTGVSTYKDGPYLMAGNGYFSMWIAIFSAFNLFSLCFFTGSAGAAEDAAKEAEEFAKKEGNQHAAGLFVTSLAVLIAASIKCDDLNDTNGTECKDYTAWAVACSAISAALCLFVLLAIALDFLGESINLVKVIVSAFLFLWWIAGTYTMVFRRPFNNTNDNGYFGAWLSLIIAFWWATSTVPGLKEGMKKVNEYGGWAYQLLAIGSLIAGLQAAHDCDRYNDMAGMDCTDDNIAWAVAAGFISFVLVIVVMFLAACDCYPRIAQIVFAIFFLGWWSLAMVMLTYDKPYKMLGNAYIGIWIATVNSYLIFFATILGGDATSEPETTTEETHEPAAEDAAEEKAPEEQEGEQEQAEEEK